MFALPIKAIVFISTVGNVMSIWEENIFMGNVPIEKNGVSPYQNEAWKIDGLKVFLFNNKADPTRKKEEVKGKEI